LTGLEDGPDIDGQALVDAYHRELVFLGTTRHYRYAGDIIEATLERVHDDGTADFNITGSGRLRLSSSEIRGLLQEDHKG
jgi:hypothetical protein